MTPFEALTTRKPDLSNLRCFGSRVYAKNPGRRKAKLDDNNSKGIFLGMSGTTCNVYYKDDTVIDDGVYSALLCMIFCS